MCFHTSVLRTDVFIYKDINIVYLELFSLLYWFDFTEKIDILSQLLYNFAKGFCEI